MWMGGTGRAERSTLIHLPTSFSPPMPPPAGGGVSPNPGRRRGALVRVVGGLVVVELVWGGPDRLTPSPSPSGERGALMGRRRVLENGAAFKNAMNAGGLRRRGRAEELGARS